MLKPCHAVFGFALLLALLGNSRGQSEQQPPNQTTQTERTQDQPAPNQRGTEQSPFVIKIMPSPESKTDTPEGAKASDEKTKLDRQLVAATWVLGGIAFLQFLALVAQAVYVARTIIHGRLVERAYVSGGGAFAGTRQLDTHKIVLQDPFQLTIDNYGKTPARVIDVQIGFCNADNIPPVPRYALTRLIGGVIPPGKEGANTPVRLNRAEIDGDVIFGRFRYRDIFRGRDHHSGFILQIATDRSVLPINGPEAYTDWN